MNGRCEICYQDIGETDNKFFCNHCGQDYHETCIETLTEQNNECPICKKAFFAKKSKTSRSNPYQIDRAPLNPPESRLLNQEQNERDRRPRQNVQLGSLYFIGLFKRLPKIERRWISIILTILVIGLISGIELFFAVAGVLFILFLVAIVQPRPGNVEIDEEDLFG